MAPPRRAIPKAPRRRELLVFATTDTAETYIRHWHRRYRTTVNVEVRRVEGIPSEVVARAVAAKQAGEKTERRGRGRAHDQVWGMLDASGTHELDAARAVAAEHDVSIAVSNPSLELWFLLHFADPSTPITCAETRERARRHLDCEDGLDDEALAALVRNHHAAVARAQALERLNRRGNDGTPGRGSDVWRLVDVIAGRTS